MNGTRRYRCDGIRRRDMISFGGLGAWGLLSAGLARGNPTNKTRRAKSCILLWLDGGPSHLETFDVKPEAPVEVRGPFSAIASQVPGTHLCELLPNTAKLTDKIAILRSMTSPLGEHGIANQYLLSGYKPSPVLDYPSIGSVVAKVKDRPHVLPRYVAIPDFRSPSGAGFLGADYDPFAIGGDPSKSDFRVRDLDFYPGIDSTRIERRRAILSEFEGFQRGIDSSTATIDPKLDQAYRMVTSLKAKEAFDLSKERPEVREAYGPRFFGQACLLARRLVENEVPFIHVHYAGWDTHESLVLQLKEGFAGAKVGVGLIPTFDLGFSMLIRDLEQRGLLEETLVIAMGEFGRTPKLNTRGGRDHWPRVFSVVLAGGGVVGGALVGKSDAIGESPKERPITPSDLAATLFQLLGIDTHLELQTGDGRPVPINQGGEPIREILV